MFVYIFFDSTKKLNADYQIDIYLHGTHQHIQKCTFSLEFRNHFMVHRRWGHTFLNSSQYE